MSSGEGALLYYWELIYATPISAGESEECGIVAGSSRGGRAVVGGGSALAGSGHFSGALRPANEETRHLM